MTDQQTDIDISDHSGSPAEQGSLKSLLGSSSMMFAGRILGAALAFSTQLLLARWMGAYELGIYAYAFSWCIILTTILGLGYEAASFRVISQALNDHRPGLIKGYLIRGQQLLLGISIVTAVVLGWMLNHIGGLVEEAYIPALNLALLTLPIYMLLFLHESIAHAFSWLAQMVLPNTIIRPFLTLMLVIIVWFYTGSLTAKDVMLYQLLSMIAVGLVHYYYFQRRLQPVISNQQAEYETRRWLRIGLPQLIPVLYISFLAEINVIMVGLFLPADQIAIFSISFRLALLIMFMVYAVDSIFRPKAAEFFAANDMQGLQKITSQCTQLMFWPGIACVIAFLILGKYILGIFGEEYIVGYEEFAILALSQIFIISIGPVTSLLNVTGHQDHSMFVFGASLIILIVLNLILIPMFGMKGAAISVFIVTGIWNFWMLFIVKKQLRIHPSVLSFRYQFK